MSGHLPAPGRPLVVEISLKTVEGDSLVLEWWRLAVIAGGDPTVHLIIVMMIMIIYDGNNNNNTNHDNIDGVSEKLHTNISTEIARPCFILHF